jgi:transcriptional regulator with XRE-family HTH domain
MATVNFGNKLSEIRRSKGITQKDAAAALGVSQALLSHYEKGIRECSLNFVVKAADYYSVSCDYLLGHENSTVRLEAVTDISDIEEDRAMSLDTMFRASLLIGKRSHNDEPMQQFTLRLYTLSVYLMMAGAAKRGLVPAHWLIGTEINDKRLDYIIDTVRYLLDDIGDAKPAKKARDIKAPLCIQTVSGSVNDYLNINISQLM